MGAIVNAANCAVAAAAGGAFAVTKSGGVDGALDASAVSAAAIDGPFLVRVKPLGSGLCYVGVSANPAAGVDAASIDRAVQINGSTWRTMDAGTLRLGSFALSGFLWLRRSGGTLAYLTGPDLATAAVKRSVVDSGAPLFFDSAIATVGAGFEVRFDPPAAFAARRPGRRLTLALGF